MKRKSKTKTMLGDNSPVMRCRAIRRRKMGHEPDNSEWGVGVALVPQEKVDMEGMGAISQQRCTVTQSDVKATWSMLEVIIADALANGHNVELGQLGTLSMNVRTKTLKEPGERIRATDVELGSITFKPGALLQKQLDRVTFKVDNDCLEPTDTASLADALYDYFAEGEHDAINVKQFTRLCGYKETRARKLMNSYVADGLMEHIPYSRGYYRPTKGNFGRRDDEGGIG